MDFKLGQRSEKLGGEGLVESYYDVSESETWQLTSWLDSLLLSVDAEDLTGEFFILQQSDPEKWRRFPGGELTAFFQRHYYPDDVLPLEADTDIKIDKGEIFESNTSKGIYLSAVGPKPGQGYPVYHIAYKESEPQHPRHTGNHKLQITPASRSGDYYTLLFFSQVVENLGPDERDDLTEYRIRTEGDFIINTKTSCFMIDAVNSALQYGPIDKRRYPYRNLKYHLGSLASIIGIDLPSFIREQP